MRSNTNCYLSQGDNSMFFFFFMLAILLCSVSLSPISDNIAIPEGNMDEVLYNVQSRRNHICLSLADAAS